MKKIKFFVASFLFCAMSYIGYSVYESATLTEAERLMIANVEALTLNEPGGGGGSEPGLIKCYNGGRGARACSIAGGIEVVKGGFSAECSVECDPGYYACCGIHCRCYPN